MNVQTLSDTVAALVAPGKGILAADESAGTIGGRFAALGVDNTEENRRDFREMLFSTDGASDFISGVILYDETLRQEGSDGRPLVELLESRGIIPGIKVDKRTFPLAGAPGEDVTEGLDGLRGRLTEYRKLGARFAKWRAIFAIGPDTPSSYCIEVNAHALGRYAALAQEAGLVPIVEPEVLMDGDHSIEQCYDASISALREVYDQLHRQRVSLEGTLLKANMIVSGKAACVRAGFEEVAERTVDCLEESVPAAVPGIVFLSGGQGDEEATANLNAIVVRGRETGVPWELSFSFARGLQVSAMVTWAENGQDADAGQRVFYRRAYLTSAARRGEYCAEMTVT